MQEGHGPLMLQGQCNMPIRAKHTTYAGDFILFFCKINIQTFSGAHEYIVHGYINNSSVLVLSLGLKRMVTRRAL